MSFLLGKTGKIQVPINKPLTENGLGVPNTPDNAGNPNISNNNANDNYSLTQGNFYWICPAGLIARINKLKVLIEDVGTMDSGRYGNGILLTGSEGILIHVLNSDGTLANDISIGLRIQKNPQWGRFSFARISKYGSGNEFVGVDLTLDDPIRMQPGQSINFLLDGNFSALVSHEFWIGGIYENAWH